MKMDIQVQRASETLNQGDGACPALTDSYLPAVFSIAEDGTEYLYTVHAGSKTNFAELLLWGVTPVIRLK
jgi:hypothetical protein